MENLKIFKKVKGEECLDEIDLIGVITLEVLQKIEILEFIIL